MWKIYGFGLWVIVVWQMGHLGVTLTLNLSKSSDWSRRMLFQSLSSVVVFLMTGMLLQVLTLKSVAEWLGGLIKMNPCPMILG